MNLLDYHMQSNQNGPRVAVSLGEVKDIVVPQSRCLSTTTIQSYAKDLVDCFSLVHIERLKKLVLIPQKELAMVRGIG